MSGHPSNFCLITTTGCDNLGEGVSKVIGDALKRIRTIYGYKANELCQLLEISPSYLSEIENNKKQPSLELLKRYSNVYGIKLSSLILLSENFEEAEKSGRSKNFIRALMIGLINTMSGTTGEPNEEGP